MAGRHLWIIALLCITPLKDNSPHTFLTASSQQYHSSDLLNVEAEYELENISPSEFILDHLEQFQYWAARAINTYCSKDRMCDYQTACQDQQLPEDMQNIAVLRAEDVLIHDVRGTSHHGSVVTVSVRGQLIDDSVMYLPGGQVVGALETSSKAGGYMGAHSSEEGGGGAHTGNTASNTKSQRVTNVEETADVRILDISEDEFIGGVEEDFQSVMSHYISLYCSDVTNECDVITTPPPDVTTQLPVESTTSDDGSGSGSGSGSGDWELDFSWGERPPTWERVYRQQQDTVTIGPDNIIITDTSEVPFLNPRDLDVTYYVSDNEGQGEALLKSEDLVGAMEEYLQEMSTDLGYTLELLTPPPTTEATTQSDDTTLTPPDITTTPPDITTTPPDITTTPPDITTTPPDLTTTPVETQPPTDEPELPEEATSIAITGITEQQFLEVEATFRANLATSINIQCSTQGACDVWTFSPAEMTEATPALGGRPGGGMRSLLQEEQERVFIEPDDVTIHNVEETGDGVVVDVSVEVDGVVISSDDVATTVEENPEQILDGVCEECTIEVITPPDDSGLQTWAIVLISVSCVVIILLIFVGCWLYDKRRRQARANKLPARQADERMRSGDNLQTVTSQALHHHYDNSGTRQQSIEEDSTSQSSEHLYTDHHPHSSTSHKVSVFRPPSQLYHPTALTTATTSQPHARPTTESERPERGYDNIAYKEDWQHYRL